jgi:DNA-directed RNA polymerase subunit RPC12/RpoP
MKAAHLYQQLERDFVTPQMTDSWAQHMGSISDYLSELFKQRSMGLVCDHAETVNKVYTAVFASNDVMQMILDRGETDILLFVHHPATWDIRTPEMWRADGLGCTHCGSMRFISKGDVKVMRGQRMKVYHCHGCGKDFYKAE